MIDVLIPVLGRAERILPLAGNIHEATDVPHQILYLCSPADEEATNACREAAHLFGDRYCVVTWEAGHGDFAKKTTAGIAMTKLPWIFFGATDLHFEEGWDYEALAAAERERKRVVGTNDKANALVQRGGHFTHPLVNRSYIEEHPVYDEPGAFYPSAYDHQCVDLEACDMARYYGEFCYAPHSVVRHLHPYFDKTVEMDATYEKALRSGQQDRRLYLFRKRMIRKALRARTRAA